MEGHKMEGHKLEFYGGKGMIMLPVLVFLMVAVNLFLFQQAFDLMALAVGGLVALFAGSLVCKTRGDYWDAVVRGAASNLAGTVVIILLVAGIFSAMMKAGGMAEGFVWIGVSTGITGGVFCAFVLLAGAIVATATGSSIGTILTAVPIFFPAGVALGCDPAMLAGAILSGAIFGDNLAPVSDVTVISASTQSYAKKAGVADIGGVVSARLPYALAALFLSLPVYLMFGGSGETAAMPAVNLTGDPAGLVMLAPVAILILVSIRSRNVLTAATAGIATGIVVGLVFGRFGMDVIFQVNNGAVSGFLYNGVAGVSGVILLCVTLFGLTGVVQSSGVLEAFIHRLSPSNADTCSARKVELLLAFGALSVSAAFASVTSAALLLFGPVGDQMGRAAGIHPYRRSHILSGMANSLPVLLPFSAFVLIVMGAASGLPGGEAVTPFSLMYGAVYPLALFVVFMFSIVTGFGRRFEGENGEPIKRSKGADMHLENLYLNTIHDRDR